MSPLLLIALAGAASCGRDPAPAPTDVLPPALAARSDVPYVRGAIARREPGALGVRLWVRDAPGSAARVTEALVTVGAGATLVWPDGRSAATADLRVGRAVTVWTRGPELHSAPPQVTADAILLERP